MSELERAKKRGYLVARRSQHRLIDAYWRWCEAQRRPFVHVRPKVRYAAIVLDMDTTNRRLSPEAMAQLSCMVREFYVSPAVYRHVGGYGVGNYTYLPHTTWLNAHRIARHMLK